MNKNTPNSILENVKNLSSNVKKYAKSNAAMIVAAATMSAPVVGNAVDFNNNYNQNDIDTITLVNGTAPSVETFTRIIEDGKVKTTTVMRDPIAQKVTIITETRFGNNEKDKYLRNQLSSKETIVRKYAYLTRDGLYFMDGAYFTIEDLIQQEENKNSVKSKTEDKKVTTPVQTTTQSKPQTITSTTTKKAEKNHTFENNKKTEIKDTKTTTTLDNKPEKGDFDDLIEEYRKVKEEGKRLDEEGKRLREEGKRLDAIIKEQEEILKLLNK